MKWHPTVLITAGSVNKNGFVFTKEVLKKLEDPDKGIRFSHDLYALIQDIPPPPPDRAIKEGGLQPEIGLDQENPPQGGSGVPVNTVNVLSITPRDFFAASALTGLINPTDLEIFTNPVLQRKVAGCAFDLADSMLLARDKADLGDEASPGDVPAATHKFYRQRPDQSRMEFDEVTEELVQDIIDAGCPLDPNSTMEMMRGGLKIKTPVAYYWATEIVEQPTKER